MKMWDMMHVNVSTKIASLSSQVSFVLFRDAFNRGLIKKLPLETQKRQVLVDEKEIWSLL